MVQEHAGRLTLSELVKTSPYGLPSEVVRNLAFQLLTAVCALHKLNVCHRDLKPDNILLRSDDSDLTGYYLSVVDFNVAVDLDVYPIIYGATGRKKWSAPETRTDQGYDEKCDVWSVGALTFYMLTGIKPFTEEATARLQNCDEQ